MNTNTELLPLTNTQQYILDAIEATDDNIFVTGKPGVGKSVLIRALRETGSKDYIVAAPTGLAAQNANGKTLHSVFGIPVSQGIFTKDFDKFTQNTNVINFVIHRVKHLIIDEISMVRVDVLEYTHRFLCQCKGNQLPFGGIQVIAFGDFYQLPPVCNAADLKALRTEGWSSEFAFASPLFDTFKPYVLSEVLRQKGDNTFINILHNARIEKLSVKDIANLNKRVQKCTDFRVRLCGKNSQADIVNQKHLKDIKADATTYKADKFGYFPADPVDATLQLKVGAQVLIKKNDADKKPGKQGERASGQVVNGSLGIVRELPTVTAGETPHVIVELSNGTTVPIYRQRWEEKKKERIGDQWTERVVASFEQIPLQLAWAISMHKSQGQSFEAVHVDPKSIFAAGQLYVALSRSRSLDGLTLESKVTADKFFAAPEVVKFVTNVERNALNK